MATLARLVLLLVALLERAGDHLERRHGRITQAYLEQCQGRGTAVTTLQATQQAPPALESVVVPLDYCHRHGHWYRGQACPMVRP